MNREVWDAVTKLGDFCGIKEPQFISHVSVSPTDVTVSVYVRRVTGEMLTDGDGKPIEQTITRGWRT